MFANLLMDLFNDCHLIFSHKILPFFQYLGKFLEIFVIFSGIEESPHFQANYINIIGIPWNFGNITEEKRVLENWILKRQPLTSFHDTNKTST